MTIINISFYQLDDPRKGIVTVPLDKINYIIGLPIPISVPIGTPQPYEIRISAGTKLFQGPVCTRDEVIDLVDGIFDTTESLYIGTLGEEQKEAT